MKNQQQALNGHVIQNQIEERNRKKAMLEEVERYELAARKFKAEYEMMDYAMKAYELKPAYKAFAERIMNEAEEAFAKLQAENTMEEVKDAEG